MSKLQMEGYYSELQQFAKKKPGQEDLAERLLKIAFDLRDYERDRRATFIDLKPTFRTSSYIFIYFYIPQDVFTKNRHCRNYY